MGQIWDFLRSVSVHFGALRQNVLKLILKSPRFVPFGVILTDFVVKPDILIRQLTWKAGITSMFVNLCLSITYCLKTSSNDCYWHRHLNYTSFFIIFLFCFLSTDGFCLRPKWTISDHWSSHWVKERTGCHFEIKWKKKLSVFLLRYLPRATGGVDNSAGSQRGSAQNTKAICY